VAYLTLGSGVGGGLIIGGKIYHGAGAGEFEIGHLRYNLSGDTVESRCSGWAVNARIRRAVEENPQGILAELIAASPNEEARQLRPALEAGDTTAAEILQATALDLAQALSHLVHLSSPGVIVLGGGLSLIGEPLREAVAHALPPLLMEAMRPGPPIKLAELGEDVVPTGALLLASLSA
jgi:glucokinase